MAYSKRFSLHAKLPAWLIVIAVVLAVTEIAARIIFPLPEITNIDRARYLPRQLPVPEWRQRPLAHGSFRYESAPDDAASVHELNLYGFRDIDWSLAKKRSRRLMFVGDSMVEGFLATPDDTIPRVFERIAREKGEDVEAWNLGLGTAGLREYVDVIQDAAPAFHPDAIVLVLHANDLMGSPKFAPIMIKPEFLPQFAKWYVPRLAVVADRWLHKQPVPHAWHSAPSAFFDAVPSPANPWTANGKTYEPFVARDIADAMRLGRFNPFAVGEVQAYGNQLPQPVDIVPWFAFIKKFLDKRAVTLLIAYIPNPSQTTDYYLQFKQRYCPPGLPSLKGEAYQRQAAVAAAAAHNLGIDFIDLTPAIRDAEARGEHLYWNYDEHLRPRGYAFVANALFSSFSTAAARGGPKPPLK